MTFSPTALPDGTPTTCFCCGRHAQGVGIGTFKSDPKFLCPECIMFLEYIKSIRSFDSYERAAIDKAGEKAGALLDEWGRTDLAELSEEQWHVFLRQVVGGFGDALRQIIKDREVPY